MTMIGFRVEYHKSTLELMMARMGVTRVGAKDWIMEGKKGAGGR